MYWAVFRKARVLVSTVNTITTIKTPDCQAPVFLLNCSTPILADAGTLHINIDDNIPCTQHGPECGDTQFLAAHSSYDFCEEIYGCKEALDTQSSSITSTINSNVITVMKGDK